MHDHCILIWVCFTRSEEFLHLDASLFLHAPSNSVGRNPICIPINEMQAHFYWAARSEIPLLTVCLFSAVLSRRLFCLSVFSSQHPALTLFHSFWLLPAFSHSVSASLQLVPRPLEILYRWTWSSQQSSGRRSTKRRRRRTGQWRRPFRSWRRSWTSGGMVILRSHRPSQSLLCHCETCCSRLYHFILY